MNLAALEFNLAVDQCEDGVIATDTDVEPGVELRSALAHDDAAGGYELTAVGFYTAILRVAVATVAGGACALFMCHMSPVFRSLSDHFNQ
jgi:hypothetical protein